MLSVSTSSSQLYLSVSSVLKLEHRVLVYSEGLHVTLGLEDGMSVGLTKPTHSWYN